MKNLIVFLFVLLSLTAFSGKRYWIGGGTNSNWNSSPTTNWCATSGGSTRVAAPGSSDSVYFDGAGANGNTNSTISNSAGIKGLSVTSGYTSTLTFNASLTVNASFLSFHSGFTIAGTSLLQSYCQNFTTGNQTLTGGFTILGAIGSARTFTGSLTVKGLFTIGTADAVNGSVNTDTLFADAGFMTAAVQATRGSLPVVCRGGSLYINSSSSFWCNNDIFIRGNVTFGTSTYPYFSIGGSTLKYQSGTVSFYSAVVVTFYTSTIDCAALTFPEVAFIGSTGTNTLADTLNATNITYKSGSNIILAGSYGFVCDNFYVLNATIAYRTHTLQTGIEYVVNTSFTCNLFAVNSPVLIQSSHAVTQAIFTLKDGATCNCSASFTRIDASLGRTISTFNGILTETTNIIECHDCFGSTIGG